MLGAVQPIGGMRVIESEAATVLPTGQPRTDDMRAMVEHLTVLGQIRRRPAAFRLGDRLVIHPVLMSQLQRRLRGEIDQVASESFFGGAC